MTDTYTKTLKCLRLTIVAVVGQKVSNIMSVCLYSCLSYPACKSCLLRRTYCLSPVACQALPHLSTLSHKRQDFRKKFLNTKYILIFCTTFI